MPIKKIKRLSKTKLERARPRPIRRPTKCTQKKLTKLFRRSSITSTVTLDVYIPILDIYYDFNKHRVLKTVILV